VNDGSGAKKSFIVLSLSIIFHLHSFGLSITDGPTAAATSAIALPATDVVSSGSNVSSSS
jgi:hypothetical protein